MTPPLRLLPDDADRDESPPETVGPQAVPTPTDAAPAVLEGRSGAPTAETPPEGPGAVLISPGSLVAFLRAGGVLSLAQWLALDPGAQAILVGAGDALRAEFALAVAAAVRSPEGAAEVSRAIDGGEAADDVALGGALDRGSRSLGRVRP